MKTQIVFTCCRCGKEQVDDLNWFNVRKFKYKELARGITPDVTSYKNELCHDCYRSLKIWLQNGDEHAVLIEENNQLKKQNTWLNEQRMNLRNELDAVTKEYENCKTFCPRSMPDYNEYMKGYDKWYEEKHSKDVY